MAVKENLQHELSQLLIDLDSANSPEEYVSLQKRRKEIIYEIVELEKVELSCKNT